MGQRKAERTTSSRAERRRGDTHRIRRVLSSLSLRFLLPGVPLLIALALVAVFCRSHTAEAPPLKAAIVDQLALTEPDAAFVESATKLLQDAGYSVDYYPPEEVTVDFYRGLPEQGYGLIVFRVHMARFTEESLRIGDPARQQELIEAYQHDVFLFSTELYDTQKYAEEREKHQLFTVRYLQGGDERYFGITPHFIESAMRGRFPGTTILLMGCDGLLFEDTAKTFVEKGARAVVGWDGLVTGPHTDAATETLLGFLTKDRLSLGEAVKRTMTEVGREPTYENALQVYPQEAESKGILSP